MNTLWRLAWALPLVLITGAAMVYMLKQVIVRDSASRRDSRRMHLRESLCVSPQTQMHLVEFDRRPYILVESEHGTVLQAAGALAADRAGSRTAGQPAGRMTARSRSRLGAGQRVFES